MKVRITSSGSERLAAKVAAMEDGVAAGAFQVAAERGLRELDEQNRNMGRMAADDEDTVRQKGKADVLEDSGRAKKAGVVEARSDRRGVASYTIRRRGVYSGRATVTAYERHARARTKAETKSGRSLRYVQRNAVGGRYHRIISVEKVLGIARAGVKGRQPARDYADLGLAWRTRISTELMRQYLSAALSQTSARTVLHVVRDLAEITMAAGG